MARRSNPQGPAGREDRRHHTPGAVGLLLPAPRQALSAALAPPPPDGGLWTGPTAAAWRAATLGRRVPPQRGWEGLRRLGGTAQGPRPRPAHAAPSAQAALKNTSRPSWRRCNKPILRMRWRWGPPPHTAWASSPSYAGSGAPAASALGPWGNIATSGALSLPLGLQAPAGRGGGCGPPGRRPRSRSPSKVPRRAGQGRASR
jgi:hypothetical protein